MAVGDYDIAPFVSPVGTEISTIQTRGNDNVLRDKFVSHQADEVAHLQSGLASARPASGTVTGETYLATDTGALSVWDGSAWVVNNTGAGDVVGDDTSTTIQNIVAYSTTGGKNITELTGTQGDVLYHNGTSWTKLAAGTSGQYLKTNGAAADPSWATVAAGDVTGDDTATTVQNIVAYNSTGGKNITELTGTQGDVLYHNGTNWAKLAAGTSGHFLKTNGAAANPAWAAAGVADGDKGDITVSASGATWTIDNDAVTYAKMQNVSAASRLLGRGSASSGDVQEIVLGTGLSMSGTTLSSTTAAGLFADGTAAAPSISFTSDTNTGIYRPGADILAFSTAGSERGQFSLAGYLKVAPNGSYRGPTIAYHEITQNGVSLNMAFRNSNATPGNILLCEFSAAAPDNNSTRFATFLDNVTDRCIIWSDGDLANHDGVYGTISDERLKQDIVDAPSQWDDLKAVRFRKYRMKSDVATNPNAPMMLGVVAQELAQTSPGLVEDCANEDGTTTMTVKSSILLMKAAKALQEAMARIEVLETEMAALKAIVTP